MSKKIIIASHKGGVNKSTIAANLGLGFANDNQKVLMIDTDSQANLSKKYLKDNYRKVDGIYELLKGEDVNNCIHHTGYENLDIIPAKQQLSIAKKEMLLSMHGIQQQKLMRSLIPVIDKYDLLIFDTAPGLDIMTFNVLQFLDGTGLLIIPVVPDSNKIEDSDSIEGMNLLLEEISESIKAGENIKPRFKVLLTEVDNDEVSNEFKLITKSHFKEKAFITEIPFSAKHARRRDNFVIEKNRTKISRCYKQLVDEIKEEL